MSRGLKLVADLDIKEAVGQEWQAICLPGGMPGAEHLRDNGSVLELLKAQQAAGRLYAAVCAAPAVVLGHHGLLPESATSLGENGRTPLENDGERWKMATRGMDFTENREDDGASGATRTPSSRRSWARSSRMPPRRLKTCP